MRIFRSLALIVLALASRTAGAQLVENALPSARFGLTGGLNLATFAGEGLGATADRHGFIGGAVLVTPFTPSFSTQLELLYAMKGMKSLALNPNNYALFKLDYLEVPLMLRADAPIAWPVKPFAFTGPSFDFKMSCGAEGVANGVTTNIDCDQLQSGAGSPMDLRSLDVGWVFGGGFGFDFNNRRISFGARYEVGLRTLSAQGSSKNRAFSLMASIEAPLPRRSHPAGR